MAEIEKMVKEAEEHKAEDDKRKEEIELKNKAESFIAQIDETLNNKDAKVSDEQRKEVEKLKDELQKAIDANDYATLKTKLDELEKAAQAMAEAMYRSQNAGPNAASQTSESNGNSDDNVVDADFKPKD